MSLLSNDLLRLFVSPRRVIALRLAGRSGKRVSLKQVYKSEPGRELDWHGAMFGFESALRELAGGIRKLEVLVSNHFAHYQLLMPQPAAGNLTIEEERAYARHCFSQVFGHDADDWDLRVTYERAGVPRVACAMPREFLDALSSRAEESGVDLVSVQPYLAAAFNQWRQQIDNRDLWLVVVEQGRLVLARFEGGKWRWLRSVRVGRRWMEDLPDLVRREQHLAGIDPATAGEVLVFCPEVAVLAVRPDPGFSIKQLQLPARTGFSPMTDGAFGLALVG